MTHTQAIPYVSFVVDDSLNGRELGADIHSVVNSQSTLVGWQCGFEPLFVAVNSYLPGVIIGEAEAEEIATDYLIERRWLIPDEADEIKQADYVIVGAR